VTPLAFITLLAGLIFMVAGAELLVRGASRLAALAGIAPLIIGLTVVSFGTSAPELAVSIQASLSGQADIALGNVVGSNIFNVLAILGISAVVSSLVVSRQLVRLDVPVMIGVSLLLWLMALDGTISRTDGLILLLGTVGYTGFLLLQARRMPQAEPSAEEGETAPAMDRGVGVRSGLLVVVGLVLLVLGSNWLVDAATAIAAALGVSQLVIGLTVVAAGTSLPELATSVIASLRGERDIAVGNVVGSNIYNILFILGSAATLGGGINVAPGVLYFDLPIMLAVAVACLPIFFTGYEIARWEGVIFLGYYVAYTAYIVLAAIQHESLDLFGTVMLAFVVPLTVLTLAIVLWRTLRPTKSRTSP
jgi:cation:H+ antiporter